jgi:Fur family zinc uptake transcriptional regulator
MVAPRSRPLGSWGLTGINAIPPAASSCGAVGHDSLDVRIDRAAQKCAAAGARLTDIRRQVLTLILGSDEPVGAYHLLDQLKAGKANATPNTVYRALEFLREQGFVHKLERLNAFVGCIDGGEHAHHAAQFLICVKCGAVTELEDHGISHSVAAAAAAVGFKPRHATVEVDGLCALCS